MNPGWVMCAQLNAGFGASPASLQAADLLGFGSSVQSKHHRQTRPSSNFPSTAVTHILAQGQAAEEMREEQQAAYSERLRLKKEEAARRKAAAAEVSGSCALLWSACANPPSQPRPTPLSPHNLI